MRAIPASGTSLPEVQSTIWLFVILAGLLGVFFIAVIVLMLLRHRRLRRSRPAPTAKPSADPWVEAGKRAKPYRNR